MSSDVGGCKVIAKRATGSNWGIDELGRQVARDRADALLRAQQWQADGKVAQNEGNVPWAQECFAKALHWLAKAKELDKYGVR